MKQKIEVVKLLPIQLNSTQFKSTHQFAPKTFGFSWSFATQSRIFFGIFLALSTFLSAPAIAQEDIPTLEPVVVTGTRYPTAPSNPSYPWNNSFSIPQYVDWGPYSGSVPSDSNSAKADDCRSPSSRHPVVIATGAKFLEQTDFTDVSLNAISMERTYDSALTRPGLFGDK
jgi:hypothetical protein